MIRTDLGAVTAYGYAVEGGYEGSEDQFKTDMENIAGNSARLSTLENAVDTLDTTVSGLSGDLDGVSSRLTTAEGDIDTLESNVSGLSSDLATESGRIDTLYPADVTLSIPGKAADAEKTGLIRNDLTETQDNLYDEVQMNTSSVSAGWRLNESNGLCSRDDSYQLDKYFVSEGDVIKVVSTDRFQFQTSSSVPSSGSNNRVGITYGAGTYFVKVPATATYLIVSRLTTDNAIVYDTINPKVTGDAISDNAFSVDAWENGSINGSNGTNVYSADRIRSKTFLPATVRRLSSSNANGQFCIYAWNSSGQYVGAWSGTAFVTTGFIFFRTLTLTGIYTNSDYAGYKFKAVYRVEGGSVQVDNVSGVNLETYISDFPSTEETIASNKEKADRALTIGSHLNISSAENIISSVVWENGGINDATGANQSNPGRIRTKYYLPTNVGVLDFGEYESTRGVLIRAYDTDGNFVGSYKPSSETFVTDGSGSGLNGNCNLGRIQSLFPEYRFRIVIFVRGGGDDVTVAEANEWALTNRISDMNTTIRFAQYNIGKFNWGLSGGLSQNVEEKIMNYKEFFGGVNLDYLTLQEFTEYIDSDQVYGSDATLFDPMFLYNNGYIWSETTIKAQRPLINTRFSYIHTSGDQGCWCIYGDSHINGKDILVISLLLSALDPSSGEHIDQSMRALNNLMDNIVKSRKNVIIGGDTNCHSKEESDTIMAFMKSNGFRCANWDYFGYKNTYNLNSSAPFKAIDQIFVRGDMRIVNVTVPDVYADLSSDHFPIIADIRV